MNSIRNLIADDSFSISFQSMKQYRTALLKALDVTPPAPEAGELGELSDADRLVARFDSAATIHRLLVCRNVLKINDQPLKSALCGRAAALLQQQESQIANLRSALAESGRAVGSTIGNEYSDSFLLQVPPTPPAQEVGAALADLENLELAFESNFGCKVRTSRIRPVLLHYATLLQQLSAPTPEAAPVATDEELLESAAKALGYKHIPSDETCLTAEAGELLVFARAILARWGHPTPPASNFDPRLIALATTSEQIPPGLYSEDELQTEWDAQADKFNQWESLDSSEQLAWAQTRAIAADRNGRPAAPPAPEVEALEARPIPGSVELAADHSPDATKMVPGADPLVTEEGLVRCYAQAVELALKAGSGINGAAAAGLRSLFDLGRQHAAAKPPGPQPASEIMPVEYVDKNGDGTRIQMEPAAEFNRGCWVGPVFPVRQSVAAHAIPLPQDGEDNP
jgi:hypothetical protein